MQKRQPCIVAGRKMLEIPEVTNVSPASQFSLNPAQRTLLAQRLRGAVIAVEGEKIPRRSERNWAPMSFEQQRMWFLDRLTPNEGFNNTAAGLRLNGELDVAAFERAINEVIRRHEILRTRFVASNGHLRQIIDEAKPVSLPVEEVPDEGELSRICEFEANAPFDLERGPVFRLRLLRCGEHSHAVLYTTHHIINDQWSVGVFIKEVKNLYEAYAAGRPSPLSELEIQYADYAHWQQGWLQGAVLEERLQYWREQLQDLEILSLPLDHPRKPGAMYRGAKKEVALEQNLVNRLAELSAKEGATIFMCLLAGLQVMLARYSGQEDIAIGIPHGGRNRTELESLIGLFVNILVFRTLLKRNLTFRQLLQCVRESALQAYAHQDLPFEKLVEELQPERDLRRNPIFQVIFAFQNAPMPSLDFGGMKSQAIKGLGFSSTFDLELEIMVKPPGIAGWLVYSADLFDEETIDRMALHWHRLMENIAQNPDCPIWQLQLMSETELHQLLVENNHTCVEYPQDLSVPDLFEAQVLLRPHAPAVAHGSRQLTYSDLSEHANRIANSLIRLGVGPETVIGVCMERSLETVEALLGILKAGAAYLPLDPEYSRSRIEHIVRESQIRVLIADQSSQQWLGEILAGMPEEVRPGFFTVSGLLSEAASTENPVRRNDSANLAYLIYTSGSTGQPKGVMLHQRGMMNHLWAKVSALELKEHDVVAQTASLLFDISVWQIWAPLISGARLEIVESQTVRHPEKLCATLEQNHVTVAELVPAIIQSILQLPVSDLPGFGRLRCLLTTGEAAPLNMCEDWIARFPHVRLLNAYGPTECSDDVTHGEIRSGDLSVLGTASIGRPIANTRLYVLDLDGLPVPVGVAGELFVGGDGVGRGYRSNPALTAEKFVPDPFGGSLGERLYRTGDLVRRLNNGSLEFIARLDNQVKVRGFRIELGEVEAALREHPAVRDAVVDVRTAGKGIDRYLVAYIIARKEHRLDLTEINVWLKSRLPEYMLPAVLMEIEMFPLTLNGKIDRRRLPQPDTLQAQKVHAPARTATEQKLVEIWQEVLGVPTVGIHDTFFELGGHSLLITRVTSRIRNAFDVNLPFAIFFDKPTIALISEVILKARAELVPGEDLNRLVGELEQICDEDAAKLLASASD